MALLVVCGINTLAQSSPATENSIPKISQSTNAPVAHVATEGKYGFIDKSGKYIIEPQFDLAGDFAEGLAAAEVGKKWDI